MRSSAELGRRCHHNQTVSQQGKPSAEKAARVVPGLSLCLVEFPLLCQDAELQTLWKSGQTPQCYFRSARTAIKEQLLVADTQDWCLTKNKKMVFSIPCCFLPLPLHLWPYLEHAVAPCCDKRFIKAEAGKPTSLATSTSESLLL